MDPYQYQPIDYENLEKQILQTADSSWLYRLRTLFGKLLCHLGRILYMLLAILGVLTLAYIIIIRMKPDWGFCLIEFVCGGK